MARKFPKHLKSNPVDWRVQKRAEWAQVIKALNKFSDGCRYTPIYQRLPYIELEAELLAQLLKGNWEAW